MHGIAQKNSHCCDPLLCSATNFHCSCDPPLPSHPCFFHFVSAITEEGISDEVYRSGFQTRDSCMVYCIFSHCHDACFTEIYMRLLLLFGSSSASGACFCHFVSAITEDGFYDVVIDLLSRLEIHTQYIAFFLTAAMMLVSHSCALELCCSCDPHLPSPHTPPLVFCFAILPQLSQRREFVMRYRCIALYCIFLTVLMLSSRFQSFQIKAFVAEKQFFIATSSIDESFFLHLLKKKNCCSVSLKGFLL